MKPVSNVVLIGMPGVGKSTVGVILAKRLGLEFVDTDVVIQANCGRILQAIVDHEGYQALRSIEERTLLDLAVEGHVIATGGSAVYSDAAMRHLKAMATLVFLDLDLAALEARIPDFRTRGLAKPAHQTMDDLFQERMVLYRRYADVTIPCAGLTQEQVCDRIIGALPPGAADGS